MSLIKQGDTELKFEDLIKKAQEMGLGELNAAGSFVTSTGEFTGRATAFRFLIDRPSISQKVDWGKTNKAIPLEQGEAFFTALKDRLAEKGTNEVFTFSGNAGSFPVEVRTLSPWHVAFCSNMFRASEAPFRDMGGPIKVWHLPYTPARDLVPGYEDQALIVLDLENREIGVAGTAYAGEIKKGVFTTCNFWAPEYDTFPMHASANCATDGSSSCVLFGLSGTGKTTLSASPDKALIGDDEIMWDESGLYNLEGGCYAKLIDLSEKSEPDIFRAVHTSHAIMENVVLDEQKNVRFEDRSKTENTRSSYPLSALSNVFDQTRKSDAPNTVVFLTADAFGALPPAALLDEWQAQYFFISGYTAKVAGTELGVKDPEAAFSACFGAPFMPRPAAFYASQLAQKVKTSGAKVWLLNTGWTQGGFGVGERFPIQVSRTLLSAIQNGSLANATMQKHPVFNFDVPMACEGVDSRYMTMGDVEKSRELARRFVENFKSFAGNASEDLMTHASPSI